MSSFNPILVWFQPLMPTRLTLHQDNLSIPSWSDFNFRLKAHHAKTVLRSFNPILVWFQQNLNHRPIYIFLVSFNPILVWFQLEGAKGLKGAEAPFNPILVWFQQVPMPLLAFWSPFIFQSHLGLISTCSPILRNLSGNDSFNPILVWFQRNLRWSLCCFLLPFNPILVWFQLYLFISMIALHILLSIPSWSDFNR